MKIYRVSYYEQTDGHAGYSFHASRREAERAARKWCDPTTWDAEKNASPEAPITPIEVEPTRSGILAALNAYASHCDNG